jgi:23S rRNA (guanine745-N1)-methyltransferase
MLAGSGVVRHLRCPLCAGRFEQQPGELRCARGHTFDIARQGYVNLLTGRAPARTDTVAMIDARAAFLAAGHYDPIAAGLTAAAGPGIRPCFVVDAGAGTGFYLAAVLARHESWEGLALDASTPAVRRGARAHVRAGAAVCDVWRGLPLADGCADLILNVFAPRNGAEFGRVLRPDGALLVLTPAPDHLAELAGPLRRLDVDPDKGRRLEATLGAWFRLESEHGYRYPLSLSRTDAGHLAAMGPSAWHSDAAELAAELTRRSEPINATVSVVLHRYLRR